MNKWQELRKFVEQAIEARKKLIEKETSDYHLARQIAILSAWQTLLDKMDSLNEND